MLGRSRCSLCLTLTPTYVHLPSPTRALVLELSKGSVQAPPERSSNSHRKRKISASSPGPSPHAGPSTLLNDHRVTVGPHSETPSERPERSKKARKLSMEDLIHSSDSEEELPNPSISRFTFKQRIHDTIPTPHEQKIPT